MDYHPLNVVSDSRAVTGVLDWARSAAGDPRADLARTEVTQLWAPIPPGPMKPLFEVLRKVMLRAWLSGYKEEAGSLPDFRPLRAWAGATLITEILPVLGNPGVWGTQQDVDRLRAKVERWAREAGIR
jgi:aminoglycoside phosphotransferase (APT) family kinase protein